MSEEPNPILREAKNQMQVVPYTKKDRRVTMAILVIAAANLFLMILTLLVWGNAGL